MDGVFREEGGEEDDEEDYFGLGGTSGGRGAVGATGATVLDSVVWRLGGDKVRECSCARFSRLFRPHELYWCPFL